jgi:hypothetical protein
MAVSKYPSNDQVDCMVLANNYLPQRAFYLLNGLAKPAEVRSFFKYLVFHNYADLE